MTEHKFTDDEVIRALECCINEDGAQCDKCPYDHYCGCYDSKMLKDTLDLINRQKAEVERWKKNCDELYEQMSDRQKAEVVIARRMGKSEAIKEFAEKIKTDAEWICDDNYIERALIEYIDNLVKEMTEDATEPTKVSPHEICETGQEFLSKKKE